MIVVTCFGSVMGIPEKYYFSADEISSFNFDDIVEMLRLVDKREIEFNKADLDEIEKCLNHLKAKLL